MGVVDEFRIFSEYFKQAGYECVIADVRDLSFDGTVLRDGNGQQIDAIWRRCVTNDVLEHWDESQELISAVRAQAVAHRSVLGSYRARQADLRSAQAPAHEGVFER